MDSPLGQNATDGSRNRCTPVYAGACIPVRAIRAQQLLHIDEVQTTLAHLPAGNSHDRAVIDGVRLGIRLGLPERKALAIRQVPGDR
jgi:hypothetical protein